MSISLAPPSFMLSTPAEVPDLVVLGIRGEEALSRLFRYRLIVSSTEAIEFVKALGGPYTLELGTSERSRRSITGLVISIRELGRDEHRKFRYRLELVPQAWTLSQNVHSRIFQDATAQAIIKEILDTAQCPWNDCCDPLTTFRERPYCVQYLESDYDFALRLMEEEGCFYFFDPKGLRVGNSVTSNLPSPVVKMPEQVVRGPGEWISRWRRRRKVATYRYRLRDQNFQLGNPFLDSDADLGQVPEETPGWEPLSSKLATEVVQYPGDYAHLFDEVSSSGGQREGGLSKYPDYGTNKALLRLKQQAADASVIEGVSNCGGLYPGGRFKIENHSTENGEYLVLSVNHHGTQAINHSSDALQGFSYRNTFTCIPVAAAQYCQPARVTRKPVVHGCQTALVIGPEAEEIWTDKYGRVRVKFPWDTGGLGSCWVRTGTAWAGTQWGSLNVPRVGQEVIVSFLDGDPDRPIIVGSVYNARNLPCYVLPDKKTQSGIVSRSTPEGNSSTFNEIRFDDKKGSEQLIVRAEKDQFNVVKGDSHTSVSGDDMVHIGGSQSTKVEKVLSIEATDEIHLKATKIVIEADQISLRTTKDGKEFVYLEREGGITIDSKGKRVWLNCGGAGAPDDGTAVTLPSDPYSIGGPRGAYKDPKGKK